LNLNGLRDFMIGYNPLGGGLGYESDAPGAGGGLPNSTAINLIFTAIGRRVITRLNLQ
jgi:hypothetical protein